MSRRQSKRPTQPWLTGKTYHWDPNKPTPPFIKLDASLMQDLTFQGLNASARWTYLAMCQEMKDNFGQWFIFPEGTAAKYGISRRTLTRTVQQLKDAGFISSRRPTEGWKNEVYAPTEYMVILNWKK